MQEFQHSLLSCLPSSMNPRGYLHFRYLGGVSKLLDMLFCIQGKLGSEEASDFVEILHLLGSKMSQMLSDYDVSAEFARLGGHLIVKRLCASSREDVQEIALEMVSSIISSGVPYPLPGGVDAHERETKNLPAFIPFSKRDGSCRFEVIIRNVPGNIHGIGQNAVGHILWPSATILSHYLVSTPSLISGKRVLEIGAGVGLCGLVAAHLGAHSVVLSDSFQPILNNLIVNVELNRENLNLKEVDQLKDVFVGGIPTAQCCRNLPPPIVPADCYITVEKLDWNSLCLSREIPRVNESDDVDEQGIKNLLLQSSCSEETDFDIIIGSDLVCRVEDAIGVARTISKFLSVKNPQALAIIVLPHHDHRFGVEKLLPYLKEEGLFVKSINLRHSRCELPSAESHQKNYFARESLHRLSHGTFTPSMDWVFEGLGEDNIASTSFLLIWCSKLPLSSDDYYLS